MYFFLFIISFKLLNYTEITEKLMKISSYPGEICLKKDTLFEVNFLDKNINIYSLKEKKKIKEIRFEFKNFYGIDKKGEKFILLDPEENEIFFFDPKNEKIENEIYLFSPSPSGVKVKDNFIYYADNREAKIYKILLDGTISETYDISGIKPLSICFYKNYICIADRIRDEIYFYDPQHREIVNVIKSPGPYPSGIYARNDTLFVADFEKDSIYIIKIPKQNSVIRYKSRNSKITLLYRIGNRGRGNIYDTKIFFAIPRNLTTQKIKDIKFYPESPVIKKDFYGEKIAIFKIDTLKEREIREFKMEVDATIFEVFYFVVPEKIKSLKSIPDSIKKKYLLDEDKLMINDSFIKSSVKKAVGKEKNPYWMARRIFNYIIENMEYERVGGWDVAPLILKRGKGSCSEYSYVMISMLRSVGIPARYVGSVVRIGDNASIDRVFHRWVEVYLPGAGWLPVDPSGGDSPYKRVRALKFGHISPSYLITTHGGGNSEYMEWNYNFNEKIKNMDKNAEIETERMGIWEPR